MRKGEEDKRLGGRRMVLACGESQEKHSCNR